MMGLADSLETKKRTKVIDRAAVMCIINTESNAVSLSTARTKNS